jgi:hypothetical protein
MTTTPLCLLHCIWATGMRLYMVHLLASQWDMVCMPVSRDAYMISGMFIIWYLSHTA